MLGRHRHRGNPNITNTYLYYKLADQLIQHALLQIANGIGREEFSATKTELTKHAKALSGGNEMVGRGPAYMTLIKEMVKYFDAKDSDTLLNDPHSRIDIWVKQFCFYLYLAQKQQVSYKPRRREDKDNPEGSDIENDESDYDPVHAGNMYNQSIPTDEQRRQFQRTHAFFFHNTTLQLYFMSRAITRSEKHSSDDDFTTAILEDIEAYNSMAQLALEYFFEQESFRADTEPLGHPIMMRIFFRLKTVNGSIFKSPFPSPVNPIPLWPMIAASVLQLLTQDTTESVLKFQALIDLIQSSSPAFQSTRQLSLILTFMSRYGRVYKLLEAIVTQAKNLEATSVLNQSNSVRMFIVQVRDVVVSALELPSLLYVERS